MIRTARFTDIPALIGLCREAHAESRFANVPFNEAQCYGALYAKIADGGATWAVLVAENDGLDGFIIGYAVPAYECLGVTATGHAAFYVSSRARGRTGPQLLDALHWWADKGGPNVKIHAVNDMIVDPHRAGRIFERRGFRQAGLLYIKEA